MREPARAAGLPGSGPSLSVELTRSRGHPTVFDFIEGWYNPRRRHSGLDYLSPMEYETRELSRV